MATQLVAVCNNTGIPATLTDDEGDNQAIAAFGITHTGGSDDDFVFLSNCSDSTFWPAHHMTIAANDNSWAVSCWANDQQNHLFYWSPFNGYSEQNGVQDSGDPVVTCSITISLVNGSPIVQWNQWS